MVADLWRHGIRNSQIGSNRNPRTSTKTVQRCHFWAINNFTLSNDVRFALCVVLCHVFYLFRYSCNKNVDIWNVNKMLPWVFCYVTPSWKIPTHHTRERNRFAQMVFKDCLFRKENRGRLRLDGPPTRFLAESICLKLRSQYRATLTSWNYSRIPLAVPLHGSALFGGKFNFFPT